MTRFSASLAVAGISALLLATVLPAQTTSSEASGSGPALSRVRIVRISEVRGAVQLDRSNGHGFEPAMANLPVVEQNRLKTELGAAEVEFEDNSTLRVAPDSEVEFPQLARTAAGSTISAVRVLKGMAYVSLVKGDKKAEPNEFDLLFGNQKIQLPAATHVRLELTDKQAKLAVLEGSLHVNAPDGVLDVPRKKTVTFAMAEATEPAVTKDVAENAFDGWDKKASDYHAHVASMSAVGGSPYSYGVNDMMYYGSFANMGGCGMMWRPYFASASWSPYSNGSWAYYSGVGYSWVSPYPWGWTPYHYGSWDYCDGTGWGWRPGGSWMGLDNASIAMSAVPSNKVRINGFASPRLPPPLHPPTGGQLSIVSVNQRPLLHSTANSPEKFTFVRDSAGMGIPREGLGNLRGFSHSAIQHGSSSTPIYLSFGRGGQAGNGTRPMGAPVGPVSIHRGMAPPPSSMGMPGYSAANGGGPRGGSVPIRSGPAPSSMGHASGSAPAPASGPRK